MVSHNFLTVFEQSQIRVTATFNEYVQVAKGITSDDIVALKFGGLLLDEVMKKELENKDLRISRKERVGEERPSVGNSEA